MGFLKTVWIPIVVAATALAAIAYVAFRDTPLRLHNAIRREDVKTVKKILDGGMHPDSRQDASYPHPLSFAAYKGNPEIAKLLIDHGADVNLCSEVSANGRRARFWPLNMALDNVTATPGSGKEAVAILLIQNGANVNQPDDPYGGNEIALHNAVCNERLIRLLVSRGGNINAQDRRGETPLHTAIRLGYKDAVPVLLGLGADPNIKTKKGETALDYALRFNRAEIVEKIKVFQAGKTER